MQELLVEEGWENLACDDYDWLLQSPHPGQVASQAHSDSQEHAQLRVLHSDLRIWFCGILESSESRKKYFFKKFEKTHVGEEK